MYFRVSVLIAVILVFPACSSFQKMKDKLQGRNQIVGEGAEDIENMTSEDRKDSDSGSISGLSTIFFDLDSAVLSSESKAALEANVKWLNSHPEVVRMELEGHCDSLGSEAYNIGLGQRRAERVKRYLKALNIPEEKLEIISYGEEKPLSYTDNAKNRRVNFVPIY
ncbi:MAG: OmpA family protein [Bdellovibrionales bacterium]|nr:OmpA family protein [Bdellovibrionales bacterium]